MAAPALPRAGANNAGDHLKDRSFRVTHELIIAPQDATKQEAGCIADPVVQILRLAYRRGRALQERQGQGENPTCLAAEAQIEPETTLPPGAPGSESTVGVERPGRSELD